MNKKEIINSFNEKLTIANYSEQTIRNYLSALKLFIDYVEKLEVNKITEADTLIFG